MSNAVTDISINGVQVVSPSSMVPGIQTLVTNSTRVGSGRMRANYVASKRTWAITWTNINQSEMETILDQIESRFEFKVTCSDPHEGVGTKTYYAGDRQWEKIQHLTNGIYHTVSLTIIEC